MSRYHDPPQPNDLENLKNINKLKDILQTTSELGRVTDVFWEEIAAEPSFAGAGHPADNPTLKLAIERVASRQLAQSARIPLAMFFHIREYGFWHGCCLLAGKLCQVFYFEDIDSGLLVIPADLRTGRMHFARFSAAEAEVDDELLPSVEGAPSAGA